MKTWLSILWLILTLCLSGYSYLQANSQQPMDNLLSIIADPKIDQKRLIQSIKKLREVRETTKFWTNIANSNEYSQDHRRRAIFQLFRRFISPEMTLSDLAIILNKPSWLEDKDIDVITILGGKIPVKFTPNDTIFVISVFPKLPDGVWDYWAIYLRVSGKVDRESFIKILRGDIVSENVSNTKLLEFALSPDNPTKVDW